MDRKLSAMVQFNGVGVMDQNPFVASDGYCPSEQEILAVSRVLYSWGGLRYRRLDEKAIIIRMLVAAHNARTEPAS